MLIFPEARAQEVTAGLKCPPEIFPPNAIATASAETISRGVPVKETVPTKRDVPRNSMKAGVYICILSIMKYLVVKGWMGFGDRLECLMMAVDYAQKNNLQIHVDWRDSIWSHGSESFYTYFSLQIPSFKSLSDIPENATYWPEYWNGKIEQSITDEIFEKRKELGIDVGNVFDRNVVVNTSADVIVFSSIGNRSIYQNPHFFANVFRVIHPTILQTTKTRQQQYNLKNSIGVHIRGTDRINRKGRENPIQWMVVKAVSSGAFSGKPMIAVSDDKESSEIWKRFFPQTILLSSLSLENTSKKGNHNVSKEELKTTKDIMNIDMLIDFFTLASCERVTTTYKDSRFAAESIRLHHFIHMMM